MSIVFFNINRLFYSPGPASNSISIHKINEAHVKEAIIQRGKDLLSKKILNASALFDLGKIQNVEHTVSGSLGQVKLPFSFLAVQSMVTISSSEVQTTPAHKHACVSFLVTFSRDAQ